MTMAIVFAASNALAWGVAGVWCCHKDGAGRDRWLLMHQLSALWSLILVLLAVGGAS